MNSGPLERVYPYNQKSVSYRSGSIEFPVSFSLCNQKLFMRVVPPDDFLEWKEMHTKIVLDFNPATGIPTADLKVVSVGIVQALPFPMEAVNPGKRITVNRSVPNTATRLEFEVDLTTKIEKTGANWVEIVMPPSFFELSGWGQMHLWQIDAQYMTKGIR